MRFRAKSPQRVLTELAAAVRDRLRLDLPVNAVEQIFADFHRRGLMFLDGPLALALALALPAVPGR